MGEEREGFIGDTDKKLFDPDDPARDAMEDMGGRDHSPKAKPEEPPEVSQFSAAKRDPDTNSRSR